MPGSTSAILIGSLRPPAVVVGLAVSLAAHAGLVTTLAIVPSGWRADRAAATAASSVSDAPIRVRLVDDESSDRALDDPGEPAVASAPGPVTGDAEPADVTRTAEAAGGIGAGAPRPALEFRRRLSEAWRRLARRAGSIDWTALAEAPAPGGTGPPDVLMPDATAGEDAGPAPTDAPSLSTSPVSMESPRPRAADAEPPPDPRPRGTSRAVVVVDLPQPDYPQRSVRRQEEGTAAVEITVEADGGVRTVRLRTSTGHRRLDEAALDAARRGRYRPALVDGTATESVVVVPVEFRLTP